eukprot:94638_1
MFIFFFFFDVKEKIFQFFKNCFYNIIVQNTIHTKMIIIKREKNISDSPPKLIFQTAKTGLLMAQSSEQIEGATNSTSIRTWMKSNNITLSEDAINKLEHNGFITTEDLQYSSPIEMDKDAKEEMNIKLADRKKLKKAMQILTGDNNTSAITLMGHTHCTKDTMSDNILNIKEGITLMGFTANEKHIKTHKNENLYIGNLHKLSDKTHLYSNDKTAHEWTMFISISNDKLIKPKSIKQVTYFLHPPFDRSIII